MALPSPIPDDIPDVQFGSMEIYTDVKFIWLGGIIVSQRAI